MNRSRATAEFLAEMGDFQPRRLTQLHAVFIDVPVSNVEQAAEYVRGIRMTFGDDTRHGVAPGHDGAILFLIAAAPRGGVPSLRLAR